MITKTISEKEKVPDLKMFVNLRSESDGRGCDDVS